MRCVHESKLYKDNCFVTLTYKDEFLRKTPEGLATLHKRDIQLFIKRLRRKHGTGIRYYYCGEYGDKYGRPHYHLCLFNFKFADQTQTETSRAGHKFYESEILNELWSDPATGRNYGKANISELNFDTAAYVARYIMKKRTGKMKEKYNGILPEFTDMSRGSKKLGTGGIGKGWYDQWKKDVWNTESIILNGKEMKPPKYYYRRYEIEYPEDFEKMKKQKEKNIDKNYKKTETRKHQNMAELAKANHEILKCKRKHSEITTKQNLIRRYENEGI